MTASLCKRKSERVGCREPVLHCQSISGVLVLIMCTSRQAKACQNMPQHAKTCQNMPQHANATKHAEKPNKRSKTAQWFHSRFGWRNPAPKHSDTTRGVLKDLILTHPRMDEKVLVLTQAAEISSRPFVLQSTAPDPSQRDKTRSLSLRLSCVRGRLSISDTGASPVQTKVGLTQSSKSSRHRQSSSAPLLVSFSCRAARR